MYWHLVARKCRSQGSKMNKLFVGFDVGTQSTRAIVLDAAAGAVIASHSVNYDFIPDLPAGHKEQEPQQWLDAVNACFAELAFKLGSRKQDIKAIGVSGQQHGLVAIDKNGLPLRAAKLWCDTSTNTECGEYIEKLGGPLGVIDKLGGFVAVGYTASKIAWLKKNEPENYKRTDCILLPHDYVNFYLTGCKVMECGDASGTGLFDARVRSWSPVALQAIDPDGLRQLLPAIVPANSIVGCLREDLAKRWGLSADIVVSTGGGDNMMAAIGTGNVEPGVVTASLGTSGTIYAFSDKPAVDDQGLVADFCDSTGNWLPLVCVLNATSATELVRRQFHLSHNEFDEAVLGVKPGADGLLLLPYLEGERTPNYPDATGVFFGMRRETFNVGHMGRAAMEGVALSLNFGLNQLRRLGLSPKEIRVTGGGAKSKVWRQIMADVFDVSVVTVVGEEGAAYGAAIQAMWAYSNNEGSPITIKSLCDKYVSVDESSRLLPNKDNRLIYEKLQALHDQLSLALAPSFSKHRSILHELNSEPVACS